MYILKRDEGMWGYSFVKNVHGSNGSFKNESTHVSRDIF